jgi:hypothetical protein
MTILLTHGNIPINPNDTYHSPLIRAVRYGHSSMIEAIIKAGAQVNRLMRIERIHAMTHTTPLAYAIYIKQFTAVSCLLRQGAELPPISEWPEHKKIYNALREAKLKRVDGDVPELREFKKMTFQEREAL